MEGHEVGIALERAFRDSARAAREERRLPPDRMPRLEAVHRAALAALHERGRALPPAGAGIAHRGEDRPGPGLEEHDRAPPPAQRLPGETGELEIDGEAQAAGPQGFSRPGRRDPERSPLRCRRGRPASSRKDENTIRLPSGDQSGWASRTPFCVSCSSRPFVTSRV